MTDINARHPSMFRQYALAAEHEVDRIAFREAADEIERLRATIAEHDRCARAVWEPRATPEDRTFWAEFGSEAGAAYGLPPSEPGAAWIVGRLGSMLDEAHAEAERLRTLFEDTERVRKSNLRACLEAQAEVERLRAVLRNLSVVVSADYEWVSDVMQAAADGRWDIVPPEAKGERRG